MTYLPFSPLAVAFGPRSESSGRKRAAGRLAPRGRALGRFPGGWLGQPRPASAALVRGTGGSGWRGRVRAALGLVAWLGLCAGRLAAAEYYVAPDGNDAAAGTLAAPFATVGRAQQAAAPGDTVWIRGGVYLFRGTTIATGILLDKSGAPDRPIRYFAYPGETPVFDFFQLATRARLRGFSVTGSWLHLRGLEVRGVQQILTQVNESWGVRVEGGSHNVFERLNLHHHEGPGFFIAAGGHNLVLNCDSHHNYDPDRGGGNADGFGSHSRDEGNVLRGCRAWCNSDDGYDFINSPGTATAENCWSWKNGYIPDTDRPAGNGAGFKAGGFGLRRERQPATIPRHVVRGCVAFLNRVQGFYANHHPGGLAWTGNTAWGNARNFDLTADMGPAAHVLRRNLAYGPGGTTHKVNPGEVTEEGNSWNLPAFAAGGATPLADADFVSLDPAGADGPRQADGSLPRLGFLRPVAGGRLAAAGIGALAP